MRYATLRIDGVTRAARLSRREFIVLDAPDVGTYLARGRVARELDSIPFSLVEFAPLITRPAHIFCVGLNYVDHIAEMGREEPEYPTLFGKFPSALLGPRDDLVLPECSSQVDWEAELAVIVGQPLRNADVAEARRAIGGFSIANDVSMRDWQRRTLQWLQGKTFEHTTPLGPLLVTPDELDGAHALTVSCAVDGNVVQQGNTANLLFSPAELLAYLSRIVTLQPGDVVLTGTPGGVGAADPEQQGLVPGQRLTTTIEGIGSCENLCVAPEKPALPRRLAVNGRRSQT
ncbi:fumarylacetoacetate hydrolase family protein [Nocardia huaxiensis]|uniref:fumarylacetoacetate hydrolase family protein n=1 Tax=Nocardia huaxiensis TaxID=2755382 RepID=UPI001E284115|nr:fumarylacetoacetate hydrolase family protein [Nocardia huaxiensis]UFS98526.1 fumarylacetoacetate hydrolase family protein [Nocardia huaxiensis]